MITVPELEAETPTPRKNVPSAEELGIIANYMGRCSYARLAKYLNTRSGRTRVWTGSNVWWRVKKIAEDATPPNILT